MAMAMILIWLACFLIAAVLLHKGIVWGGVFGAVPALHMIYRGGSEVLIGVALLLFYLGLGIFLWKKRDAEAPATSTKPIDIEIENKMTPFFNVFLDDKFQSCHYGTERYI